MLHEKIIIRRGIPNTLFINFHVCGFVLVGLEIIVLTIKITAFIFDTK